MTNALIQEQMKVAARTFVMVKKKYDWIIYVIIQYNNNELQVPSQYNNNCYSKNLKNIYFLITNHILAISKIKKLKAISRKR